MDMKCRCGEDWSEKTFYSFYGPESVPIKEFSACLVELNERTATTPGTETQLDDIVISIDNKNLW
jgi:hypothetical protein